MATVETIRGPVQVGELDWFGADHDAVRAAAAPDWHCTHISDDVLPALRAAGVTEPQLEQMLVGNPRRYFGGMPS